MFTWLVDGFNAIDFDEDVMIKEFMSIGQRTKIFYYSDLRDMSFKLYTKIINEMNRQDKERKNTE